MSKKKVLVTGGAGYIGSHTVVELIESGYEVVVVDNFSRSSPQLIEGIETITGKKIHCQKVDCIDKASLSKVFKESGPISSVIHFAAFKAVEESVREPLLYYHNNLQSLIILLETMQQNGVKELIFSSSCTVYGQLDKIPVDEKTPFGRPESPYGATKQMSEHILEDVAKHGFKIITLRYFNPIGAHPTGLIGELPIDTPNNLVPYITQTAAGIREKLVIFGGDYDTPDGTCIRDFIHVVDLAKAHVSAVKKVESTSEMDVYNLGTGLGIGVLQLVKEFIEVTGVNLKYEIGPRRPGDITKIYADPSKAFAELKWSPQYSTKDALKHAWEWEKKRTRA